MNGNWLDYSGRLEAIKTRILQHKEGSIQCSAKLSYSIIKYFEENGLKKDGDTWQKIEEECTSLKELDENLSWTGILIYHVGQKYFNLERLGLGQLKLIKLEMKNYQTICHMYYHVYFMT